MTHTHKCLLLVPLAGSTRDNISCENDATVILREMRTAGAARITGHPHVDIPACIRCASAFKSPRFSIVPLADATHTHA